ncbi:putative ribonuclease H-like domain-containing protein, partial [Tanacetum coccineum]
MEDRGIFNSRCSGHMTVNKKQSQILGDPKSSVQTRSIVQQHSGAHALEEPKKISEALKDDSWVEAMQEELLQFRLQHVWILVDLPHGAKVIGTKWVYRNKRDERGVVVRNKARLVAQGHRQEEGIDYDEVFALVTRIEAITQDGTHDDCSFQDNGIDDQQVNTASPQVNTSSREVNTAAPEINTATPEGLMGPIPTTEDTQVEDQEIELGNISPSYEVSSTPHIRIHKDHP